MKPCSPKPYSARFRLSPHLRAPISTFPIPTAEIRCDALSAVKDHQRMAVCNFGAFRTHRLGTSNWRASNNPLQPFFSRSFCEILHFLHLIKPATACSTLPGIRLQYNLASSSSTDNCLAHRLQGYHQKRLEKADVSLLCLSAETEHRRASNKRISQRPLLNRLCAHYSETTHHNKAEASRGAETR